jgi:hypothetical protein
MKTVVSDNTDLAFALWEGMHDGPYFTYQDRSKMWHVLDSVDDSVVQTKSKKMAEHLTALFNQSIAMSKTNT